MVTTSRSIGASGARWKLWRNVAAILAIGLLSVSVLWADGVRGDAAMPPTVIAPHEHHAGMTMDRLVVAPAAPTDGVLTIVIPRGTDAAMKASGNAAYHLPSVIRLRVGDTVVIRNEDTAPHMLLYTFLLPGETDRRTFTTVGSEAYTSGCAANAADFSDFTTIFISGG